MVTSAERMRALRERRNQARRLAERDANGVTLHTRRGYDADRLRLAAAAIDANLALTRAHAPALKNESRQRDRLFLPPAAARTSARSAAVMFFAPPWHRSRQDHI